MVQEASSNDGVPVSGSVPNTSTDAENLATARSRIAAELADGPIKPNYEIEGQRVDWSTYRRDLIRQLNELDSLANTADDGSGIVEESTIWRT